MARWRWQGGDGKVETGGQAEAARMEEAGGQGEASGVEEVGGNR